MDPDTVLTSTCERLVNGADVDPRCRRFAVRFGDQPDDSHFCVQLLGPGLCELTCPDIPASPLQEQTMNVAACVWFLCYL